MHIPIVIVAYNRAHTLERLLSSLSKAHYPAPVKLIISIDGGGTDSVKKIAEEFEWQYGQKEVIAHKENLGLRRHILSCGDLTSQYDGIILLEDDLFVSPGFYQYTLSALDFYKECREICGVSLYSYQYNETAFLPFKPLNDGSDVYFMQLPCSWGQAWLKEHWTAFRSWYDLNADLTLQDDRSLPANISFWSDASWKKYFIKYIVETNKFFVYPYLSNTTNFGDKGQHLDRDMSVFQVPLAIDDAGDYRFRKFAASSVKYDVFCELLPECLVKLSAEKLPAALSVDLYGTKRKENLTGEFVLTSKKCSICKESFALQMLPHELNIINRIPGNDLFLARVGELGESGAIDTFVYGRALDEARQKYYFCADDVHFGRMRDLENRLLQEEEKIRLMAGRVDLPQHLLELDSALRECQVRLSGIESSQSWRLTRPLRWFGNKLRGKQ